MSVVKGKNVVFMWSGKPVACARSYNQTLSVSSVEATTVGDGTGATWKPQKNTHTANMEGVVSLNDVTKWTYPELVQAAIDHTLFTDATVVIMDENGFTSTETFDFYISQISRSGAVGDFNTFQMDLQINGNPVIT